MLALAFVQKRYISKTNKESLPELNSNYKSDLIYVFINGDLLVCITCLHPHPSKPSHVYSVDAVLSGSQLPLRRMLRLLRVSIAVGARQMGMSTNYHEGQ